MFKLLLQILLFSPILIHILIHSDGKLAGPMMAKNKSSIY